ncbi:MAG: MotA/TolQ/ExbB proton channel family protein [Eubacterium sp.]|nr:MotA/TolQ/ExbB proton channel family protein [Eubacterium sp.]MDD7209086.1 MotA/TolQ/ExbB proton channel family protein [Lachnospiraceae bacterium]MDY5496799.1 MotA/TolQ/ExbB proton channel family protein [Anaerobutyricum sp.]
MSLKSILHVVGQALSVPCMVVLLILMIITVLQVGHVIAESFFERKHQKVDGISLVKKMQGKDNKDKRSIIENSGLYPREKEILFELFDQERLTEEMKKAIAQKLLEEQEAHYGRILNITETVVKLGPMFGLLGTLIPLGPGIVALGHGDTMTLSSSMETAFDTTIAGMISAAVCSVLSGIRKRWYARNIENVELLMEGILQEEQL